MQENNFDSILNTKIDEVKECQKSLSLNSCFECEKLLECEKRASYVKSVYESMSQGDSLDFDF
jgi:hypothetical protein